MRLTSLTLHQFKGVENFALTLEGNSATVYGQNGSGKSTLADAYMWLLTGKNNAGETFDPFPVNEAGSRKHQGQEPTVEAEFTNDDGNHFTLKRALIEKRTKKRGHSESNYTGDETKCWIDGVPNKISEYNSYIEQNFTNESTLRLLTNTGYFNTQIKKDERRKLLFETFGDMTDTDILQATPELAELSTALGRKSVDEYQRMIKAQYTDTCKQLDLLPVRIDEAAKSIIEGIDAGAAKSVISKIGVELATLRYNLANDKKDPTTALQLELQKIKGRVESENIRWSQFVEDNTSEHNRAHKLNLNAMQDKVDTHARELEAYGAKIMRGNQHVMELESEIADKRKLWTEKKAEWIAKGAEVFTLDDANCPTCGQAFPPEKLEEMEGNWNERKAEHLSQISAYMKQIQESGKNLADELEKCNIALAGLNEKREAAQQAHETATANLKEIQLAHKPYEPDPATAKDHAAALDALQTQIAELESQIATADQGENPEKEQLQQRIAGLESQLATQQEIVATAKASEEAQNRIDEYSELQKELGAVRDHAEKMLDLCDQFIRIKSEKITDNINRNFQIVKFSLFETQKNGGLKQICEPSMDGVGYDQLNKARQTAASLDIILTFSKTLEVSFPLFVDNSESFHTIYGVDTGDSQIIKLAVSEQDKELRLSD